MTWPGHESFAAKIVRIFVPVPASQRVKRLFDNKRRGHLTRISELLMLWKHCLQSVALEVSTLTILCKANTSHAGEISWNMRV